MSFLMLGSDIFPTTSKPSHETKSKAYVRETAQIDWPVIGGLVDAGDRC